MRPLSIHERGWMSTQIAMALEKLGIDVTPKTMERELQHLDAITGGRAPDYTPPDPYQRALCQMKKEQR